MNIIRYILRYIHKIIWMKKKIMEHLITLCNRYRHIIISTFSFDKILDIIIRNGILHYKRNSTAILQTKQKI